MSQLSVEIRLKFFSLSSELVIDNPKFNGCFEFITILDFKVHPFVCKPKSGWQ